VCERERRCHSHPGERVDETCQLSILWKSSNVAEGKVSNDDDWTRKASPPQSEEPFFWLRIEEEER